MDLTWWPVAAIGLAGFVITVALAAVLPMTAARKRLRPLANVARLTRLPEYARVARLRSLSTIVTLVVLTIMFGAATWAAARPTGPSEADEDIMLCVGQPVNDPATAGLLTYFAQQMDTATPTQRIGLTSQNRRLVPLTRDHQYAAAQFGEYAEPDEVEATSFAPPVPYTNYASTVGDVLALCFTGFPNVEEPGPDRRSVLYLGPSELGPGAAVFSDEQVRDLAQRTGIRLDVIDTAPSPASGSLQALSAQTGGDYLTLDDRTVEAAVDDVRSNTVSDSVDAPAIPLTIALLSAAVLSVALMVLRR